MNETNARNLHQAMAVADLLRTHGPALPPVHIKLGFDGVHLGTVGTTALTDLAEIAAEMGAPVTVSEVRVSTALAVNEPYRSHNVEFTHGEVAFRAFTHETVAQVSA